MTARPETAGTRRRMSLVGRNVGLFAGVGAVLGGVAGTLDFPLAGTFFGAVGGAVAGAVVGGLDAVPLMLLACWTRSRWTLRVTSGLAGGAAVALAALVHAWPVEVPAAVAMLLVLAATFVGGALGPLIVYGAEAVPTARPAAARLQRTGGLVLAGGAAIGAAAGGIAGLIIGVRTNLPTAPFAVVEGAVLGAVSGVTLACLAVGLAVLPRLRARR